MTYFQAYSRQVCYWSIYFTEKGNYHYLHLTGKQSPSKIGSQNWGGSVELHLFAWVALLATQGMGFSFRALGRWEGGRKNTTLNDDLPLLQFNRFWTRYEVEHLLPFFHFILWMLSYERRVGGYTRQNALNGE